MKDGPKLIKGIKHKVHTASRDYQCECAVCEIKEQPKTIPKGSEYIVLKAYMKPFTFGFVQVPSQVIRMRYAKDHAGIR